METFPPWQALCEGNPPVTGRFPSQSASHGENNRNTLDLRRHHAHYDITVMIMISITQALWAKLTITLPFAFITKMCILGILFLITYYILFENIQFRVIVKYTISGNCKIYNYV